MIRKPFNAKRELLQNLGARRAQIQEQKIEPLLDEFDLEVEEHIVLRDLKIVRLFRQLVELHNDYLDTVEETHKQLIEIISKMVDVCREEYVSREEYEKLQKQYIEVRAALVHELEEETDEEKERVKPKKQVTEGLPKGKKMTLRDLQREEFMKEIDMQIYRAVREGKHINMMKKAFRDKLNIKYAWQGDMIDWRIDEWMEHENEGEPFDWTIEVNQMLIDEGLLAREKRSSGGK